jgi:hypothetical protein
VTNAIPDLTKGLFKRPGAKRIGTNALANVQSGGSWFHYFRDESEGAYIGQIAANGQVRIWSCKTGVSQTITYGTGGMTAIQNYLATSTPENLQFLTINDTTFVNNRDTDNANTRIGTTFSGTYSQSGTVVTITFTDHGLSVGNNVNVVYTTGSAVDGDFLVQTATTNTITLTAAASASTSGNVTIKPLTDAPPDAHYGFIELLRTENGRQYGVNINSSTVVTQVRRATRIKVTDHSFDEGDGSGHCPGIGTEVYSAYSSNSYPSSTNLVHVKNSSGTTLTSGRNNLTFRITALGQQGVSPNYSASQNGPGGQNYRCSYNIEATLLHGGEGWQVGDVVRVVPEHASNANSSDGQAYIDITVTDIETTEVNATISSNGDGLIRPSPTPFDADTAVTADTIIGGIIDDLPAGVSGKHIGTGIYLSSPNPFSVEVVEEDLMRCFQTSVNDVQNLPNQCKHGYIVKISNSRMSDEDDYYLRFDGANNRDGVGSWSECAKAGIAKTLTNMPLVIQRTGFNNNTQIATFTVKQFDYQDRRVGDDKTNPMPSFVDARINKVLFFRNRLALLSGENVITSRPGTLGTPDFFNETALTVSASDPVDISAASTFPSELFDGIEVNTGLVVFSTNQQFLLAADDTVFNPDTAKLRSIATFNYNETIAPISLGTTLAYVDNSGKFSRFNEMANIQREGEPSIVEVSKVVPTLLPKDIDLLTNSRENSIILLGKTGSEDVLGYKYFQVSEQRQQAAWFKWKLNNPLTYHFIINDEYFFLDSDYYLQSIKLVQTETDPSIVQDNVDFLLHVDNHTTLSGGSFDSATNTTTFSSVGWLDTVTSPNHELVVIDTNTDASRVGRYAKRSATHIVPTSSLTSGSTFNYPNHGFSNGDKVLYDAQGGTPITSTAPSWTDTIFFIKVVDANNFRLSSSYSNAVSNIGAYFSSITGGNDNQTFTKFNEIVLKGNWSNATLTVGYIYPYEVKFPTFYPTRQQGNNSRADVNSSLVLHRIKFHFGKIGLYETTLERVGKTDYTEVYESTELDEYDVSDAPYLEEFIKTVPVYEKNTNVDVTLRSSHPAPATLRAVSWEGDYSPKYYKRV